MPTKLYNTLTQKIEPILPNDQGEIGFYACGITAYDYAHIGNLRRYVMDDLLIRLLRYQNYRVKHVQNVTDVGHLTSDADTGEDKMEKTAAREHKNIFEVAKFFETYYWSANQEIGNLQPDFIPHATAYIEKQLVIAQDLEKKGFAYLIPGEGLYFDTSKVPHYGELAGLNLEKLKEGARIEAVPGRKNPTDFAVWKLEKPGENRQMVWPSPWGERSFPGWHLECVAMSIDLLGEQFELHSGGIDHIPVHHTNEIAQAEAYTGKRPFVKHWLHHNFMRVEGKKMSKSIGNIITLAEIKKRGFHPLALRYLFLTAHYRKELNFTWDSLAAAQKAYDRLIATLAVFREQGQDTMSMEEQIAKNNVYRERFLAALNNDLNTAQALVVINEILKINLGKGERYDLIAELDRILGLDLPRQVVTYLQNKTPAIPATPDEQAERLLAERETARANQDFARADFLRDKISLLGYQIIDTPKGPQVKKNSG